LEDIVKVDRKIKGCDDVDWIHVAQGRDFCGHGNEPSGSIRGEKLTDELSDCHTLEMGSSLWSSLVSLCIKEIQICK